MKTTRREGRYPSALPFVLLLAAGFCLGVSSPASASLTIHSHFLSSNAPSNLVGGGNIQDIFHVATNAWERAFSDLSDPWEVNLDYEWAPLGTTLGYFTLESQGGTPHREQSGLIQFNNSGLTPFFADPTPLDSSEYQTYTETFQDLGGGTINVGRIYSNPTGDAANHFDLLQLAEHEIGHALGMSSDNTEFQKQIQGQTLTITSPRPYDGTTIFMFAGHIDQSFLPTPLMVSIGQENERKLLSGVDILAEAQLSTFNNPNLDSYAVPELDGQAILGMGVIGFGLCCIKKRACGSCLAKRSRFNARQTRRSPKRSEASRRSTTFS